MDDRIVLIITSSSVACGCSDADLYEAFNVALVVGGSIVIPHLRHAVESLDLCRERQKSGE